MKFGQALSIFESAFPEEMAAPYRAMLTKLQDSAPPLPPSRCTPSWPTARAAMAAELRRVRRRPGGRGVDRAGPPRRSGGTAATVAVKIQYPGAGPALLSDLAQVSRVGARRPAWVPGIEIGPILAELKGRMAEELDYRLEARTQRSSPRGSTATRTSSSPGWSAAPSTSSSPSGSRAGRSRDHPGGNRAGARQAAQLYMEFLLAGPSEAGLLHADPHPGNFRITPDGRLGVLDFGAVNRLPNGMPPQMGRLLTAALDGGADAVLRGLRETGFIKPSVDIDAERLLEYLEPFIAPLRDDEFTFTRAWLRGVFAHINDPRQPNYTVAYKLNLPPEYLLIHRVWGGGIGVLSQLGGTVRGREAVDALLPGAEPAARG